MKKHLLIIFLIAIITILFIDIKKEFNLSYEQLNNNIKNKDKIIQYLSNTELGMNKKIFKELIDSENISKSKLIKNKKIVDLNKYINAKLFIINKNNIPGFEINENIFLINQDKDVLKFNVTLVEKNKTIEKTFKINISDTKNEVFKNNNKKHFLEKNIIDKYFSSYRKYFYINKKYEIKINKHIISYLDITFKNNYFLNKITTYILLFLLISISLILSIFIKNNKEEKNIEELLEKQSNKNEHNIYKLEKKPYTYKTNNQDILGYKFNKKINYKMIEEDHIDSLKKTSEELILYAKDQSLLEDYYIQIFAPLLFNDETFKWLETESILYGNDLKLAVVGRIADDEINKFSKMLNLQIIKTEL